MDEEIKNIGELVIKEIEYPVSKENSIVPFSNGNLTVKQGKEILGNIKESAYWLIPELSSNSF